MNKKLMTLLTAIAVTGSILSAPLVFAADTAAPSSAPAVAQTQTMNRYGTGSGTNYADKDQDGVCDNLGEGIQLRKQDGSGNADGSGQNFVDADQDGVCDNLGEGTPLRKQDGSGTSGSGQNFVDADQDGICDNLGEGTPLRIQDGSGSGQNRGDKGK